MIARIEQQRRRLIGAWLLAGMAMVGLLVCLERGSAASAFSQPQAALIEPNRVYTSTQTTGVAPSISSAPGLRRLTNDGHSTPQAWTQDGQTLLVKRPGQGVPGQQFAELWEISLLKGEERYLSDNASWPSVHGDQVAYLRFVERGRWETVVRDLSGAKTVDVGEAQWHMPPTWANGILYYLQANGRLVTSSDRDVPLSHSASLPEQTEARLSFDGAYLSRTDGQHLWVVDRQGQKTVDRAEQLGGMAWSPAAAQLAYVRSNGGPSPELWVWDATSGRSWLLVRGQSEHFDRPAWSPDGDTLAFARHPTGSGPNRSGDIWIVDAQGTTSSPLALTPTDERAPRWSPQGNALAFSMEGDVWIADLEAPGLQTAMIQAAQSLPRDDALVQPSQVTPLKLSAPATIRVKHDAEGNTCRPVPDGQIDELDFEEYIKRVVPHEVYTSWPTETLKTQAVAARTYAWRKILDRIDDPTTDFDVWDSTRDQYMCANTYPSTNEAVDATRGQYIAYDGTPIYAFFCAEAGSPTNYQQDFDPGLVPYLRPVNDPVSLGQPRNGHSWGMSQWGAYRWAGWHGWDYAQILAHYYTGASIARSNEITAPLTSVTLPWSDFYVNTGYAYLRANATDDTGVMTVTFAAQVTDTWQVLYTDTEAGDGWQYVWPLADLTDTSTPSIAVRVTAHDQSGQVTESTPVQVGLNRTPPTGTLDIASTEVTTLSLSLDLSASDPTPSGDPLRFSLGIADWIWQANELYHQGGAIVSDPAASDGRAWHVPAGEQGTLYGPYTDALPTGHLYRAYFRLKVAHAALGDPQEWARLDVSTEGGTTLLGVRYLRGTDLKAGETYQEFAVDLVGDRDLEFRVDAWGTFDLWVDRVLVVRHPQEISTPAQWTLPAREGDTTLIAKFADGAENTSEDTTRTVTVRDETPPGEWQAVQWELPNLSVQVRDVIAGLDVHTAAYRYVKESSGSWSEWLPASCTGEVGSHNWETISADLPAHLDHLPRAIQFRISDAAQAVNQGQSPQYAPRHVYLPVVQQR